MDFPSDPDDYIIIMPMLCSAILLASSFSQFSFTLDSSFMLTIQIKTVTPWSARHANGVRNNSENKPIALCPLPKI